MLPLVANVGVPIPSAYAAESISYDFNTAGDLASTFNGYVSAGTVTQSTTGGIGNSGAIEVNPSVNTNAVYSTKDGYSLGPVGSTYTFSSQMRSFANSGYSGMGFTSLTPGSGTTGGSPFHPNDAIGVSVHGGGYVFHNGTTNVFGNWSTSYSGANSLWTISTGSGINTGCNDADQDNCWYQVVFKITRDSSTTFDARVELYGSSQSGSLDSATPIAVVEFRDQTNNTLTSASLLYSYINFSGQRMKYFDDFQVSLAGGASVISAGAPVVLTSSTSETSGIVTVAGNVTSDGGASVTDRGFAYGASANPTTSGNKVTSGSGTGTFSGVTPTLTPGTYYFRAYATNATGTSYGSQETVVITAPPTVTFDANGGSGSMSAQTSSSSTSLSSNSFTRAGYSFTGWNTVADGSGTDYSDGATFAFSADDTLYAQWVKAAPPIVAANDAFVQPGDADGASSSTLVLKNAVNSASSSYNRVGYARFEFDPAYNWTSAAFEMLVSSNADGASNNGYNRSYTTFNVDVWAMSDASWDDTLRFSGANASVQDWGIDTSTWPWSPEGGTYLGTISIPTLSSTVGQTYSLSNATLATFLNADADGEVTLFFRRSDLDNQGNLSFASIENSTAGYHGPRLVAPSGSYSYTIAYDVNGGSGTLPSPGTYTVGSSAYTVAAPSSVTPPSGKTFSGWNSKADGSGTQYSVGSSYSTAASATLYAQFTTNPVVTFASNDGNSVSSYQAVTSGASTALTANSFTRTGYTFSGWNTAANGSGTSYADGANITTSSAVTLYAQWAATSSGSSGGGSSSSGGGSDDDEDVTPAPVVTPTVTRPNVRLPLPTPTPPRPTVLTAPAKTSTSVSTPVDQLVSRIGGVPAPVSTSSNGGNELSVSTSSVKLSLKMTQAGTVAKPTAEANAELTIQPGARAAVTGSGLLPNTTVQVWLPNVSDRELGRLSVNADGEIQGELGLSSKLGEDPLPIGRQTMQVTGYDADGNQTVVEMPVNIAQGAPAPEHNRESATLPDLSPGESLTTSAGLPTIVSVTPLSEQRVVAVDGGDWTISVAIGSGNGEVSGTSESPLLRMVQSGLGSVTGNGFQPGTVASVWLFSDPTLLGTVTVAEDGSFDAQFLVDAQFIPAGEHTLQIQGVGTDGFIKATNLGVLVDAVPAETFASSAMELIWWAAAAFLALLLLVVGVIALRRGRIRT